MKENQKLALKIIFMSVIVLSCADNNVRPINYSNETVKNNEIELSKLEEKKTSEDKISALTVKKIEINKPITPMELRNIKSNDSGLSSLQYLFVIMVPIA